MLLLLIKYQSLPEYSDPLVCAFQNSYSTEQFRVDLKQDLEYTVARFNECQGLGKIEHIVIQSEIQMDNKDVIAIRDLEIFDYIETIAVEAVGAEKVYHR